MPAEVLQTHTAALFAAAVERAAAELAAGRLVALPTETVYGLAANALDAQAVARIFEVKGRPPTNPVIVHVVGLGMARECASLWPVSADRLAQAFWPGPLTLVLGRSGLVPEVVAAGGPTVGIRWPSHPFMQAVIARCGFPLAAPSANASNQLSPTQALHVKKSLGDRIALVVDGGHCQVGIESTVLDLADEPARILRPGVIHRESLMAAMEAEVVEGGAGAGLARSPGQLPRHYAPRARLAVWRWQDDLDLGRQLSGSGASLAGTHVVAHTHIPGNPGFGRVSVIPHDAEAFGRALYAELHRCDEEGAEFIVVEAVPEEAGWEAVADRLRRAAH